MTTTQKIDAYCDALKAWQKGECVEQSPNYTSHNHWFPFNGGAFDPDHKYRVAPAPPKLRDVLVKLNRYDTIAGCAWPPALSALMDGERWVKFREVDEKADAEIAELQRNHDALCRAIETHRSNYPRSDLFVFLEDEGARLP